MKSNKRSQKQEDKLDLNLDKWIDLLKLFKDKNLIELIEENQRNQNETSLKFYEGLFYIFDSNEDFRELMDNPSDEEISENPFNQFYGICDIKPSQVKMKNPSILHLNKTNTDAIFCFLIKSIYDLNNQDEGKIDKTKLKKLFQTNFNFTVLKEISFLYNLDENLDSIRNDKPFNLCSLIITLEILNDLFGNQITHINVGLTDYLLDFFSNNKDLNQTNKKIFFSDLYFAYVIVFLFYNRLKTKNFNPFLNSVGLSITVFENHPDLIEPFTFNSYLFAKFCDEGMIGKNLKEIAQYDLFNLIKIVSVVNNEINLETKKASELYSDLSRQITFTHFELALATRNISAKSCLDLLLNDSNLTDINVYYQYFRLTIYDEIYFMDNEYFVNLLTKIKNLVRNFSLNLIPSLNGDGSYLDSEKLNELNTLKIYNKQIEIDLSNFVNEKSSANKIRSICLQGNNFKLISATEKISSLQEFYFFPNLSYQYNLNFLTQFSNLSHLTLRNLNLENFEKLTGMWKQFSQIKSVDLSILQNDPNSNLNEKIVLIMLKFLWNIYELDLQNSTQIEKIKIFVENINLTLEDKICRNIIFLMQKVFSLIYFSLIYKCDIDLDKSKSKNNMATNDKLFQDIKKVITRNTEEYQMTNEKIFNSEDKMSYLLISENEMESWKMKNKKPKNELIPIGRWKMDEFISLFLLIHGKIKFKPLRRSPILVKFFHYLAKPIKNRIFFIENYN